MRKFTMAVAALAMSAPAYADARLEITSERLTLLQEASKTICRRAIESSNGAEKEYERAVAYLKLTPSENLIMLSLCILYAQGRIDE